MATRTTQRRWYWPTVGNLADAEWASNAGFWAALMCAVAITLVATLSLFAERELIGVDPFAYVDAALFAIIAWRIRCRSRVFAVIGLALFAFEKVYQFVTQPLAYGGALVAIALLLAFVHGVRGTFAWHRLRSETPQPVAD